MPDENKILTALGLDTSQFESGVGRAANKMSVFGGVLNSVDKELRSIPLIGDFYAIGFGKIVDGFVRSKEEAREFARIMRTDVAGGLDETMAKLEDTTALLGKLKVGDWSRTLSDIWKDTKNNLGGLLTPWAAKTKNPSEQDKREEQIAKLEKERAILLKEIVAAHEQDEVARSEAYSKSILITDQAKIQIEYANRLAKAQAEATKFGGPDREKWSEQVNENLKKELALAELVRDSETEAANRRAAARSFENSASVAASYEAATGSARSAAAANLRAAQAKYEIDRKGTAEQEQAALAALNIAENQMHAAQIEYEFAKRQSDIETELLDLQVRGQTRAANQAKIRADYETRIVEETRRGNRELADNLKLQEKSALLAEEIREYELGGSGRARERQEERRKAQTARIAASHLAQREQARERQSKGGLTSAGLQSTGLQSGSLNHSVLRAIKDKPDNRSKQDKFMDTISEQMGKIVSELSG